MMSRGVCVLLLAVGCAACRGSGTSTPEEWKPPTIVVTRWTEKTELLVEFPALVAGETSRFAVHLTNLADFKPVVTGRVAVRLAGGPSPQTFVAEAPSRPGIFGVNVRPGAPGRYVVQIALEGTRVSDAHELRDVIVHPDARQAAAAAPGEDRGGIAFLKEQQWTLDFGTTIAGERSLRESLTVPAEIRPRAGGDAMITAPLSGRLQTSAPRTIGTPVGAGEVLAEIVPHTESAADPAALELELSEATAALSLATAERERTERLIAEGAVPARRAEEARIAEQRARAAVEAARTRLSQRELLRTGRGAVASTNRYIVRSPISGVVARAAVTRGSSVEQGEELFRIVATDTVTVVAHVPESQASRVRGVAAAEVVSGEGPPRGLGRVLSRGRVVDAASRTVPVVFEWRQPDPAFAIGQSVQVRLFGAPGPINVVVPESALVDDAGRPVVFVQTGGETFERRPVRTGRREGGLVEISEGVRKGDRVVVRGAPLVRLAALSTQVPAHGHVH